MANFHYRIRKLERLIQKPFSCAACGAGDRMPRRIIRGTKAGPLDRCAACDGYLDETGWPVATPCVRVRRGKRLFMRL